MHGLSGRLLAVFAGAAATEVERLLDSLLARLGVDGLYLHAHPSAVADVRVLLELGAGVGDWIAGEYTSLRHGTCLLWPRLRGAPNLPRGLLHCLTVLSHNRVAIANLLIYNTANSA